MSSIEISKSWGSAGATLSAIARLQRLGHSYLLLGPANSGKTEAAWYIAKLAICNAGGCGECDDCARLDRHNHPDVHVCRPQSAQGYLISQIRDVIVDLQLSPIRSSRKVYILHDVQDLTGSSANALLKSLEEPPTDTLFILLANSADAVLPTIVSRCQIIQFPATSPDESLHELLRLTGSDERTCRRIMGFCPEIDNAREFLESPNRQKARQIALDTITSLPTRDDLDLLLQAEKMLDAAKETLSDIEQRQAEELRHANDLLAPSALKDLEERQKRELSAAHRESIIQCLQSQRAFLKDSLMIREKTGLSTTCDDYATYARSFAERYSAENLLALLHHLENAIDCINRNLSPRLVIEAMLLELKEIHPCRP